MANIANKLPTNVWEHIQTGAGVLLSDFKVSGENAWTVDPSKILGSTTGGINFTDTPEFTDFGEDIDNCPKNTKELKRIDNREIKVTGTYVSITADGIAALAAAADVSGGKITPRNTLKDEDFKDIWFVGNYGTNSAIAIHLMNALSTAGFAVQTTDKGKGNFSFEYTAHYSINDTETVPYEVYEKPAA